MITWFLRSISSYYDSKINILLTVACFLAWVIVAVSLAGVYITVKDRTSIIVYDCPPCQRGPDTHVKDQ